MELSAHFTKSLVSIFTACLLPFLPWKNPRVKADLMSVHMYGDLARH